MDNLQRLDTVAAYKFGVLTQRLAYLKFKDENELYVLTDEGEPAALITLMTRQGDTGLQVNDYTLLELEEGKIYYLKPAPPPSVCLDAFDVQKYALVDNLKVNAEANNQLAFITERLIDCLKTAIGNRKLRMSCWPFNNVNIATFLEECGIPHHLVIQLDCHGNYIFDKNKFLQTDCDDDYPPEDFFKEIRDVSTNGNLFCDCKTLVKKVTYSNREHIYNGSSVTWGSTKEESELEKAFVIFNPDATEASNSRETILPVSTPDCIEIVF
jgi:hypothetical protein